MNSSNLEFDKKKVYLFYLYVKFEQPGAVNKLIWQFSQGIISCLENTQKEQIE